MQITREQSVLLDAVRGMSALAVMLGHGLSQTALGYRYPLQSYAVVVFFALSGLLIAQSVAAREEYSFTEYLIDRFARIFTCFIPALVFIAVVDAIFALSRPTDSVGVFIANMFMLGGVALQTFKISPFELFGSGRPLWSLVLEWWIYVGFGAAVFATRLRWLELAFVIALLPILVATAGLFAIAGGGLSLVWVMCAVVSAPIFSVSKETAQRLWPGLMIFFLLTSLWRASSLNRFVPMPSYDTLLMLNGIALFLSSVLMAKALTISNRAIESVTPFTSWLAGISYPLFLTHYTILAIFTHTVGDIGWADFALYCAISIAVAEAFRLAFDQHYPKVRRWLKALRAQPAPAGM